MKYSDIPAAQSVVYQCKTRGVKNIVISPGSRNAPLTIGFIEDPYFECFSIVDERCAAFFALGMAQQLRKPVALVCTSGSALVNYFPAVTEAFYSDIPLVIISADRPPEKIDIGDGQTIKQENIYGTHVGYTASLKQDVDRKAIHSLIEAVGSSSEELGTRNQIAVQKYNDRELNTAFNTAFADRCPVHVNVPFEEPLYGKTSEALLVPEVEEIPLSPGNWDSDLEKFAVIWNTSTRKMILVGVCDPGSVEEDFLEVLAKDPSLLVFTETTSNIYHPDFFPSIDSIIAPIEKSPRRDELFSALQPEVLLTFGGMIVSKKIKAFLRKYQPKHHWHVDSKKAYDTFFCLSKHFKTSADHFFSAFLPLAKTPASSYFETWSKVKKRYIKKRQEYLEQIPFSDLKVFSQVQRNIPEGYQVQLANSSTIRYSQLIDMKPSLRVFCNRGTSGIDGSTSTAIGAAFYDRRPTLLISGDLSFFYDSNALWNNYLRADFRIIVINNQGGGIFRILPGKEDSPNFQTYFETVHDLELKRLCALYGLNHSLAADEKELREELSTFYQPSKRPKLLEIRTPRALNDKILLTYFDFLS